MATSNTSKAINVSVKTHERLAKLKQGNETFNDIVVKLVEMDEKYNPKEEIMEYEFLTENISKVFRVHFLKDKTMVCYYTGKKDKFAHRIKAWDNYPGISDVDRSLFVDFIVQEDNLRLLRNMGHQVDYENFTIRRVGSL